jgi:hypothetical protein
MAMKLADACFRVWTFAVWAGVSMPRPRRLAGGIERVNAVKQSVTGVALGTILILKQHGK